MLKGGRPEQMFAGYLQHLVQGSETILDIGTSQRFAKELRAYQGLFEGKKYMAAGYRPMMRYGAFNCDCHQDIEAMDFGAETFDAVICLEVLEHVKNPVRAVAEVRRVLKPNGVLLLTTPFLYGFHGKEGGGSQIHDEYPDYWRFTHQGLERMFGDFRRLEVKALDGPVESRLWLLGLGMLLGFKPVRWIVDRVDQPTAGRSTTRHLVFATK